MIENDLHNQGSNLQGEERSPASANQHFVIASLFKLIHLVFDTLYFLLAPGEILRQSEEDFDQQIHNSGEG